MSLLFQKSPLLSNMYHKKIKNVPNILTNLNKMSSVSKHMRGWGHACIQGARPYNEDMYYALCNPFFEERLSHSVVYPSFDIFCVLDGHAGSHAAYVLKGLLTVFFHRKEYSHIDWNEPENINNILYVIEHFYEEAHSILKNEKSGVVSIIAICLKTKIILGWLGDCEGCIFINSQDSFDNPIIQVPGLCEIDFATINHMHTSKPLLQSKLCTNAAKSRPHAFGKSVCVDPKISWTNFRSEPPEGFCKTEIFSSVCNILPSHFECQDAQHEYDVISTRNMCDVTVDITKMRLGNHSIVVDTRLSQAIQPTRSLGDCAESNTYVLRDCSVMDIPLAETTKHCFCVLCSDGMLHSGAFTDIKSICQFVINPIKFIKNYFYNTEQDLTIRLIASGLLPPNLTQCFTERDICMDLIMAWHEKCNTWSGVLKFIINNHLKALESTPFIDTFTNQFARDHFHQWLSACKKSIEWLKSKIHFLDLMTSKTMQDAALNLKCELAVHFAVIMGSEDNITMILIEK